MRIYTRLLCLLVFLAPMSGCALLKSRSVVQLAKIAREDGDRVLREPMRPVRGTTRVLIFALDGVGRDDFLRAVRGGRMPNVAGLLGPSSEDALFDHAYAPANVLSVLPSSTTAAWTSVFTGKPPGETGVPGNEWFDRVTMRFHAPTPVTTDRRYQVLQGFNEDVLGQWIKVPTLYEQAGLRANVSMSRVYRGADLLNIPEVEPFGSIFNAGLGNIFGGVSAERRLYKTIDRTSVKSLEESLRRYGFADMQTIYFPGIDLFTHVASPPLERQQRYLEEVTDPAIGAVLASYREAGLLEQTYVLFVSDHGQTPVGNEDRNALWRQGHDEPPAVIQRAGFRMRPWGLKTDDGDEDFQAAFAYQGGLAYLYLADRSSCPEPGMTCDWSRPPRLAEDVMPAVRFLYDANSTGAHVPQLQNSLDLILARPDAGPGRDVPPFQVFDGERLVPMDDYLEHYPRPDLLALKHRLDDLATGPYGYLAGDVLLLSRMALDDAPDDRTYFGEGYHTWHGSANRTDSEVLFLLAHTASDGHSLRRLVDDSLGSRPSHLAATPLVLMLLGR